MRPTNQTKKIIYGLVIVLLFSAMYPYTQWLDRVKDEKDLGEAAIGQVDSGSFMMKLFLLGGFRGIVANYLWIQAEDHKKNHDWDRLKATVDLITKLQPHFLSIWTFQGWNLAYNVSVEWDAPEDKYEWIKQGIKFVQRGVENNQRSPDLIWDTAWFYYHKLGFSDESIILRRLFRDDEDEDFKKYVDPDSGLEVVRNDNFQLGYGWFSRSVKLVDDGGTRLGGGTSENIQYIDPTPQRKGRADDIAFRSMPSHAQTHYAAALEKMSMAGIEATFGEVAKNEWTRALAEWVKFGSHVFQSHNEVIRDGKLVRDEVRLDDATNPERYKTLTENAQYWTDRWASQMNYRYWKERCEAERTSEGVAARQLFYEGTKAYKTGDFSLAAAKFRDGLTIWNENLKGFPTYREDDLNKKDTGLVVKRYVRVLRQLGEPVPDTLPFKDLLAAAEADNTVDPFDAIEMLGVGAGLGEPSSGPPPTTGQPASAPAAPPAGL
ncbi:hypothetical protein [Paludisphaera soli]|uniref:hypothetical protein n=1 Tax=Paludisphaera soli TaxID=2712865 RepID=UPI0013EDE752|nr:hypothetical protein [Paludisphaera soli]